MARSQDFTQGEIMRPLLRFALPVLCSILLQTLYGAVDLWVVGKYAMVGDVSGVGTGSLIMQTITVAMSGLALGITVQIGQYLGERRPERISRAVGSSICFFFLFSLVVTALMVGGAETVAGVMRTPEEAFLQTVSYVRICSAGTVFIAAYNVLGSIFRGLGNSKLPLITVIIACCFNLAGDLLLVAALGMGAAGAAAATVMAQALSVLLSVLIARARPLPFSFSVRDIRFEWSSIARVLSLGAPVAIQDVLVNISFLVTRTAVNSMGVAASSGVGVAAKLANLIMLLPQALMQAMATFTAQNIGAGKPERARRALAGSIRISLGTAVVMAYLAYFHGDVLSSFFASDSGVIAASADYLRAYAIDCLPTAFMFCLIGYYNGLGLTRFVMLQGMIGAFCVRIPIVCLVSRWSGATLFHLGLATPASSTVQVLLCLIVYYRQRRKKESL